MAAFEKAFSLVHNQQFGVMTNSGTDALRIALAALKERGNWKDGDAVFVPALTFVATVNVVLQLNLKPILLDIGLKDFTLNPWRLEDFMTMQENQGSDARVRAVLPVHLAGNPCNMKTLCRFAKQYNLSILEDSCEAMGIDGICQGDVSAFSFYVAHILTTGVGGMATTNDPVLRKLMWSYANHGRKEAKKFEFERIGYSCRPTEFEAVLGLNQLPKLKDIINRRRKNCSYLNNRLRDFDDIDVHYIPESACMFFPVMLREHSKIKKWDFMNFLDKRGIESRELMPLTHQPCYKDLFRSGNYYGATAANNRGFYIGCHQGMTQDDLDEIIEAFTVFLWGKGERSYPIAKSFSQ